MRRYVRFLGLVIGLVLIAAACGGDEPTPTPSPSPTSTPTPTATATPTPAPAPEAMDGVSMTDSGAMGGETMEEPSPLEATIENFSFPNLTVVVGTTVTWTNQDAAPHTTTSGQNGAFDGAGWNSDNLSKDASFSHTFQQLGTFAYTCRIHPNMSGTVTVVASGEGAVSSGPESGSAGMGEGDY